MSERLPSGEQEIGPSQIEDFISAVQAFKPFFELENCRPFGDDGPIYSSESVVLAHGAKQVTLSVVRIYPFEDSLDRDPVGISYSVEVSESMHSAGFSKIEISKKYSVDEDFEFDIQMTNFSQNFYSVDPNDSSKKTRLKSEDEERLHRIMSENDDESFREAVKELIAIYDRNKSIGEFISSNGFTNQRLIEVMGVINDLHPDSK